MSSLVADSFAKTSQKDDLPTLLLFLSSLQRNLLKLARPQATTCLQHDLRLSRLGPEVGGVMVAFCLAATMSDLRAWAQAHRRRCIGNELPSCTTAFSLFLT